MGAFAARYVRFVVVVGLIAVLIGMAFFGGYRWGYLDGYAQFSIDSDGVRMRLVPMDPPARRRQ